jgi:hypothetical protein
LDELWTLYQSFGGANQSIFPALGSNIAETKPVNISQFIIGTLNNSFLFIISCIGIMYSILQLKVKGLFLVVAFGLAILAFFMGNRFMIFSSPILALGLGFFIQLFFKHQSKISTTIAMIISLFILILGIYFTYNKNTALLAKPAVYDNKTVLNAIDSNTSQNSSIWTNWGLGYQINYYLDRKTFADGGNSNSEMIYYLNFPIATQSSILAANFIKFYTHRGKNGLDKLYQKFNGNKPQAFEFIKKVLSKSPKNSTNIIASQFKNVKKWLEFFYPKNNKDIYLVLHKNMTQHSLWFYNGSYNLKTKKHQDRTFISYNNLKENKEWITNGSFKINKQKAGSIRIGSSGNYIRKKYHHILTRTGKQLQTKPFNTEGKIAFEWIKPFGYGAIMSLDLSKSVFNKLFIRHKFEPKYFKPIKLKTPHYQIWQVIGDVY